MDNKYTAGIDKFINDNRENIIRDIARLVAINSVEGAAEPGAPFGKGPKQALELGLEICRELGLKAVNCEDKIGYGQIGDTEDYLATITHLDVVPVGEGWTGDPFTLREREGYIIGRGVMDDKGPSVLCLYALKYLKDAGVPLRYSIRALLGTNEETGMGDVEYYLDNYKAPVFCFSPDSGFPVCNGEKGICNLRIVSKTKLDKIADIRGGVAGNVIPGKAEAWVKGAKPAATESVSVEADGELWHLTAKGIGGHASKPEGTVNAIGVLISYILENKLYFPQTFWDDFPFNLSVVRDVERVSVLSDKFYHFIRKRAESETAKYRSDMYDKREEENGWMEELFAHWGVDTPEVREFLARRYIERVIGCVENITNRNCPLSAKEKKAEIKRIISTDRVKKAVKTAKPNSKYMKIMLLPVKWNNVCLTYLEGRVISKVKSGNTKTFAKLKAGR